MVAKETGKIPFRFSLSSKIVLVIVQKNADISNVKSIIIVLDLPSNDGKVLGFDVYDENMHQ
jgi:hypothetical protein